MAAHHPAHLHFHHHPSNSPNTPPNLAIASRPSKTLLSRKIQIMPASAPVLRRPGSGYAQATIAGLLATVATVAFLYATVVVLPTAQKLRAGEAAQCRIVRADLSCWRRSFLSFSQIEQGHHACWVFQVELNSSAAGPPRPLAGAGPNASAPRPFTVQYAPVHAFSKARDECESFETCGNATWACTVVASADDGAAPSMVRLRWRYPTKKLGANLTVAVACYAIAAFTMCQYLRLRATGALADVCKDVYDPSLGECVVEIGGEYDSDEDGTAWDSARYDKESVPGAGVCDEESGNRTQQEGSNLKPAPYNPEMSTSDIILSLDEIVENCRSASPERAFHEDECLDRVSLSSTSPTSGSGSVAKDSGLNFAPVDLNKREELRDINSFR